MEQNEMKQQSAHQAATGHDVAAITPAQEYGAMPSPAEKAPCSTCASGAASMPVSYVYASGQIKTFIPRKDVEKELAQVAGRSETTGMTDQKVLHDILSKPENLYLARQMCWVLTIQGLETYILLPRNPVDFARLVEALPEKHIADQIDLVIGHRGPIAPPEMCNGLMLPIVEFDIIYSFTRNQLINAIPCPAKVKPEAFRPAAEEVFDRIMQMTDNVGATDEDRLKTYLAFRSKDIYIKAHEEFELDFSLTGVDVFPSPLSGARKIYNAAFKFENRKNGVTEKFCVSVDVTEEFPFQMTRLVKSIDY